MQAVSVGEPLTPAPLKVIPGSSAPETMAPTVSVETPPVVAIEPVIDAPVRPARL